MISYGERVEERRGEDGKIVIKGTVALFRFVFTPGVMLRWLLTRVIIWDLHHELCVK